MAETEQLTNETPNVPQPEDGALPQHPDDDQISTFIARQWAGKVAYFRGGWRVEESGCWYEREDNEPRKFIRRALVPHRHALRGGITQARINAVAYMLQDDVFIPDRKLTEMELSNTKYINLKNGLFNLDTFQLEPHNPDLLFTTQLDFAFDEDADCKHFKRFLRTSLAKPDGKDDFEMVQLVQEALAYSMTARTDLKASFWCVGLPDTGKSTLIGFIRGFMGSLHSTIDLNQLATNRFLLSGIVGKRVVTFTEADSSAFIPDALYKAMVGGQDEIYVDVKNKPGISFVPTAKFWWAMNSAPKVNDRSGATLNRLIPILFEHVIPPSERNPRLPEMLQAERAGVFNYLLDGYANLMAAGRFTLPERSKNWRENYQRENDIESLYASERWVIGEAFSMGGQELYDDYRAYCERNGYKPKNAANAAKEWKRLGLDYIRSHGKTVWKGGKLIS